VNFNTKIIRYGLSEARFIKSFKDIRIIFHQKLSFFFPRLYGKITRREKAPPALQIEPTNRCNLVCVSCPRDRMKRPQGFMDFALFKKIIDDASANRVKRVHLYLHGEPLLHPQICEMIHYIKKTGMGITLTTNGMALNVKMIEKILEADVDSGDYFTFSILGGTRETHEKLMVHANHEKVKENIQNFIRLRALSKKNGPIIETVFYEMPENKGEAKYFQKTWEGIVDHIKISSSISKKFRLWGKDNIGIPERKRSCKNLWERLAIAWNGDVILCCLDVDGSHLIGNMNKNTISEMWNSPKLNHIKDFHLAGRIGEINLCKYCDN
jgi:radical SAM protein with 4Fe4S-binding SPASM domain